MSFNSKRSARSATRGNNDASPLDPIANIELNPYPHFITEALLIPNPGDDCRAAVGGRVVAHYATVEKLVISLWAQERLPDLAVARR